MIIRGWHVDGFGHFADWAGPTLGRGVTVILGANEAGKSTLLAFLRGVLFGFPSKNAKDEAHIPPLKGGAHGGRVFLEDESGGVWTVERHKGKKPLLHAPDGSVKGEAELVALLGHLDAASYRSVFGFDLADLGRLQALDEASVRDRLLSAWVTGAGDSVTATTRLLDAAIKEPLSSKGELGLLLEKYKGAEGALAEALAQVSTYAERHARLEALAREIEAEVERLKAVRADAQKFRNLIRLKPVALLLGESSEALAALPDAPSLPADSEERFAELASELKAAVAELARARELTAETRRKLGATEVDRPLAELDGSLAPTLRTLEVQKERLLRLETLRSKVAGTRAEFAGALRELGGEWDGERLSTMGSFALRRKVAARFAGELDEAARELAGAETAEAKARARSGAFGAAAPPEPVPQRGSPIRAWVPAALAGALFVGAALLDRGAAKWGALAGALALSALAAWGFSNLSRPVDSSRNQALDLARAQATAEVAEAAATLARCREKAEGIKREWAREWGSWGISPGPISPDDALELLSRLEAAANLNGNLAALSREEAELASSVEAWERQALLLLSGRCAPDAKGLLLAAAVEDAGVRAREEAAKLAAVVQLGASLKSLEAREAERAAEVEARREALGGFFARLGVADEFSLREAAHATRARAELTARIAECSRQLDAHFGTDEAGRAELASGSSSLWEGLLDEAEEAAGRLEEGLAAKNRAYGGEAEALDSIRSSSAVQEAETLLSSLRARAADAATLWRRAALARELLKAALASYAAERQPGVLGEASSHFEAITGGRYKRVVQPPGETQEVRALRADGALLDPAALSRGTREELYFAIRLGLAKDFTDRGAKLPVLADDVFVNFDPDRASRAYAVLAGFSPSSQVVIFTCHPDSAARIVAAVPGANVLTLTGDTSSRLS